MTVLLVACLIVCSSRSVFVYTKHYIWLFTRQKTYIRSPKPIHLIWVGPYGGNPLHANVLRFALESASLGLGRNAENQESLQIIADFYFNIEMNIRRVGSTLKQRSARYLASSPAAGYPFTRTTIRERPSSCASTTGDSTKSRCHYRLTAIVLCGADFTRS